jgi:fatty acid/phospholipid biosynthesis enzyme
VGLEFFVYIISIQLYSMNIGIDMMGGDFAPKEAVLGIKLMRDEGRGTREEAEKARHEALGTREEELNLTLFGDENQLNPLLEEYEIDRNGIKIVQRNLTPPLRLDLGTWPKV